MKTMKKTLALLIVAMMIVAMLPNALADSTISVKEDDTRSYDVYQIFTGELSEGVLSNVKWGKNGTEPQGEAVDQAVLDALTAVNSESNTTKLQVIKQYVELDSEKFGTVSKGSPLSVPDGYYLFVDKGAVGDGEAYSLFVTEVVGSITINPKRGNVVSDKKVKDTNDSTANSTTDWQDSADYDIGDEVPFKLSATIAQDYANYTYGYKLTFHDKEETGLTFNPSSVRVFVDNTLISDGYTVVTEGLTDGCTFEVRFANLKGIDSVKGGSVISVEYTSTLNDQANIGSTGNKNTSHVTYTNNPNDEQYGENGKTPDDTVIVFTYRVVVNKVRPATDHDNTTSDYVPLEGAGFTLYKKDASGSYTQIGDELKGDDMTTFTWKGLDDGDYKLVETTTPAGYNTIADIEFTITAGHVDGDSPYLDTLSGDVTSGTATFTPDVYNGSLSTDVVNNSGSTLPSTGGMGTTVFYVVGSILVIGAVILLVSKKRMNAAE